MALEILTSSGRSFPTVVMQLFGLRVAERLVAMVSMLRLARGREGGGERESACGIPDEASSTSLSKDARSGCPAMPCPYCVLELDHLASHDVVMGRWRRLESQFFTSGGSHQVHLMRPAAVTWIDEALRSDLDLSSREGWARIGRLEPSTHAHAVCQRLVSNVPRMAVCLEGFFWSGEGPSQAVSCASACGPSRPRGFRSQEAASSGWDVAVCPPLVLDEHSGPDALQWFYYRSGKKMNKRCLYDDTCHKVLRTAWSNGRGCVRLNIEGWVYEVDLGAMTL